MSRMSDYDIQIDEHVRAAVRLTMETGVSPISAGTQICQRVECLVGRTDRSYALAELRDGTGFRANARFVEV